MSPSLARRPRTCALCGWRDATGDTEVEGKFYAACARCADETEPTEPEPPPPPIHEQAHMRWQVPQAVRRMVALFDGITAYDLSVALGMTTDAERNNVSVILVREVRAGRMTREGVHPFRVYRIVRGAA